MRTIALLMSGLIVLIAIGCGSDDPGTPPATDTPMVSGSVDAGGGELVHEDITLTIPPGALGAETELAIHRDEEGHPFGEADQPIYRLSGLPTGLGEPVTLRFRFVAARAVEDVTIFIGEVRESHDGGRHPSWESYAARDSAGWIVANLPRGPYDLGDKSAPELSVTASILTQVVYEIDGHFAVNYDPSEVTSAEARNILGLFENDFDTLYNFDFRFGDQDTIWPLNVYMREPVNDTVAEYIIGPWGRGHFNLRPSLAADTRLPVIVLHELFHCAQDYYDTRHPSEWTTVNPARHWLDEATAAFMEGLASGDPSSYTPIGMNWDNYLAPMSGIWGHDTLSRGSFGYGMSSLIRRLVSLQGYNRIHDLYEAYSYHGTAYDALLATTSPPLSQWCAQLQRDLVTGGTTPLHLYDVVWEQWPIDETFDWSRGVEVVDNLTVHDFGSDVAKLSLGGGEPPANTGLKVRITEDTIDGGPFDLAVYGRIEDEPVLLATGVDSLVVDDWAETYTTYDELLVQVIKPFGAEPDYHHPTTVRAELEMIDDLTRFESARISMHYQADWSDVGVLPWQGLNFNVEGGSWSGNTYTSAWDSTSLSGTHMFGQFSATVDLADLSLTGWSVDSTWQFDADDLNFYHTAGAGRLPLAYEGESELRYELTEGDVCDVVTSITVYQIRDGVTTKNLDSWTCIASSDFTFRFRDED